MRNLLGAVVAAFPILVLFGYFTYKGDGIVVLETIATVLVLVFFVYLGEKITRS